MEIALIDLKLLFEKQSKFQNIKLYETNDNKLMLCLDTYIQFIEGGDEEIYHDILTRPAIEMNSRAKKFLLLGAGDGLAARNIFYRVIEPNITIVDIDREVVILCMINERLKQLNQYSLLHCNLIYENALKWVKKCNEKYDIIICDFPDANNENLKKLYTKEFYSDTYKLLDKGGVISIQTHYDISNKVSKIIKEIFGNVKEIDYKMDFLDGGKIIYAKNDS